MEKLSGNEIRELFLSFYESKKHIRLPSASLVPEDTQLLFTVAGMVPFKPIFWGKVEPTYTRVTTCQKCVRTNDIEQVGRTPRHHTFFEMLGNFSFGDYFKKEAIEWAWEFITTILKLPVEKVFVSVYKDDQEAYDLWTHHIGLPGSKITKLGKEDNFWGPAGPSGPCGPDTEIFFDMGPKAHCPNPEKCAPGCDCGRYLEFYNLVFTESNQDEKGNLTPLARKNIDTGLGLERLTAIMQQVSSNFETDLFIPIIRSCEEGLNLKYGENEKVNVALRVVADHVRSASFMLVDGILPSNEGRGYVLKRLIRRAMRFGWLYGKRSPFLYPIVDSVAAVMGGQYPELASKIAFIKKILKNEEEKFFRTLEQGMTMIDTLTAHKKIISGEEAFKLYDTFGFPIEVTQEVAQERGIQIDIPDYRERMKKQKEMARCARGEKEFLKTQEIYESIATECVATISSADTVGTDADNNLVGSSRVLYLVQEGQTVPELKEGDQGEMIVESTPFFSEKGGQASDIGTFHSIHASGEVRYVFNPFKGLIAHQIAVTKGSLKSGEGIRFEVSSRTRNAISRNHTATHLLHAALRETLGNHVKQAGSLVESNRLRFDFTHYEKITSLQLTEIENWVNERVLMALPVVVESHSIQEAKAMGAMALFDEKYKEVVRVVKVGTYSMELCGGTHVRNTGEIGMFKILSESAISAGVRRIEAITGWESVDYARKQTELLTETCRLVATQPDLLLKTISKWVEQLKESEKANRLLQEKLSLKEIGKQETTQLSEQLTEQLTELTFRGAPYRVIHSTGIQKNTVRTVADQALEQMKSGMILILNEREEQVDICVKVTKEYLQNPFHAGKIVQKIAAQLGGNGGGKPDFALAGGKNVCKISEVIARMEEILQSAIQ